MAERYPSQSPLTQSSSAMEDLDEPMEVQHRLVADRTEPMEDQCGLAQFGLNQESALQLAHETGEKHNQRYHFS